jgi:hypothetical protein
MEQLGCSHAAPCNRHAFGGRMLEVTILQGRLSQVVDLMGNDDTVKALIWPARTNI